MFQREDDRGDGHLHHYHDHGQEPRDTHHAHTHGVTDPTLLTSARGIWAIQVSLLVLLFTALVQLVVALLSGSVALLADTLHNFGDAGTAIPLWVAFRLGRRAPTRRFTYGYGRVEDLAGVTVVLIILLSAVLAGYESVQRLLHPQSVQHLWAVMVAALVGFAGNEGAAWIRLRIGKEIGSIALIADGYHARGDGLASLSVMVGAMGVWLGFPLADPIVGLVITVAILRMVWESGQEVFTRLLDGIDPEVVEEIGDTARRTPGVQEVSEVRVRWLGHRLLAELNLAVDSHLSVAQGHTVAGRARHRLLHSLSYLSNVTIHVDPVSASGESHHHVLEHSHGHLPPHSH